MNLQVTLSDQQASKLAAKAADMMKLTGQPYTMQDMVRDMIDAQPEVPDVTPKNTTNGAAGDAS